MSNYLDIPEIFHIHLITSYLMLGIVIITQFITYPMYNTLPDSVVIIYQSSYLWKAFVIIGPIMLLELVTAIILARNVNNFDIHSYIRGDIAILLAIWAISLLFELPAHFSILNNGVTGRTYTVIMFGNVFRLVAWGLKCVYVSKMIKIFFAYEGAYKDEFLNEST